jgi:hypothetical protein
VNNLRKLKRSEHLLIEGYEHSKKMREKLKRIKDHYLLITLRIGMKKEKMKNLNLLKKFLEENLLNWVKQIKLSKDLKKKKLFSQLFTKFKEIQNEISIFSSTNQLIKRRKILITNAIIDKINQKIEKVKNSFNDEYQNIFTEKKSDINDIYNLFKTVKNSQDKEIKEEFIKSLKKNFKR